jgi:hypothetical protein
MTSLSEWIAPGFVPQAPLPWPRLLALLAIGSALLAALIVATGSEVAGGLASVVGMAVAGLVALAIIAFAAFAGFFGVWSFVGFVVACELGEYAFHAVHQRGAGGSPASR